MLHAMHHIAYHSAMALVQVRDVSDATVVALKIRASERGVSLAAYLRAELERLAARPTNAEIAERLASRNRRGGPTAAETVAEIRRIRDAS
jgi:plasmid stability protein